MIQRRPSSGFGSGYTAIVEQIATNTPDSTLLNFGILRLRSGSETDSHYRSVSETERAFLLLSGEVRFEYRVANSDVAHATARRDDFFEDEPTAFHVPGGVEVEISVQSAEAELVIQEVANPRQFAPRLWRAGEYRSELFSEGVLEGVSTRRVRTIFDAATAPESAMVLGEVCSPQGRWSSYPPHTHAHPEIYHFRFSPVAGFGYSEQGDQVYRIEHEDTALIPPNVTHPQVAAAGYALFYVWGIPHLPNDRFGPDSRQFVDRHKWLV